MHSIMNRFRMLALAALLAAGFVAAQPTASFAADAAATKIATINIQAILRDSAAAKSTKEQIEAKRNQFQGELKKLEEKLHKEEQGLQEQKTLLSQEALEQKRADFIKQVGAARKELDEKRQRLDAAYAQALGDIQQSVTKIVEKMAAERGYQLVIPTSQLMYAVTSLDITKEVLAQLDKDLSTVKLDFSAPAPKAAAKEKE